MKQPIILLALLIQALTLTSQNRPLTYFSQVTFGNASYTEIGEGIISTGFINSDSIADIGMASGNTFQIGYGQIENGQLHFDMQAVDFELYERYSRGTIVDMDGDGDGDFTMGTSIWGQPIVNKTYFFECNSDMIETEPSQLPDIFPNDEILFFGQFNQDNIADCYYRDGDEMVIIDGTTGESYRPFPSEYETLITTSSSQIDMDGDGMLDLLLQVGDFNDHPDSIIHEAYLNRGDFVFEKFGTNGYSWRLDYGDFDGDGQLDIVYRKDNFSLGIKTKLLTDNNAILYDVPLSLSMVDADLMVYDLNQDGFDDFLLFKNNTAYFYKNNQDQTFTEYSTDLPVQTYTVFTSDPTWPNGYLLGESYAIPSMFYFEFDGVQFTANKSSATISPPIVDHPPYYHKVTTLDRDMDGLVELAIENEGALVSAEVKDGSFHEYTAHQLEFMGSLQSSAVATADCNNDGILDLIYGESENGGLIHLVYGQADSTFSSPVVIGTGFKLCFNIETADFDGNGFVDVVASGNAAGKFSILFNQNGTDFTENLIIKNDSEQWNIFDPNQDGVPDLSISKNGTRIFMNDGLGNMNETQYISDNVLKTSLEDSKYIYTEHGSLYEIDASGAEKKLISSIAQVFPSRTSYVLDYNLDGLPDVLYSNLNLYENEPDTTYLVITDTLNITEIVVIPNRQILGAEDMDGDGTEDVLWKVGSQLFVEFVDSPIWSNTKEQTRDVVHFVIPENEILDELEIWDMNGRLIFSQNQKENFFEASNLEGVGMLRS